MKSILQIDISNGTQWGDSNTSNFIRKVCIPSVKNYCIKYGYKHILINESVYERVNGKFDFFKQKPKHYAFERYYHLNTNYDQSVYLDNDIYIFKDAEPLPSISGLMVVKEPNSETTKLFQSVNMLSDVYPYYNSGVLMCDKDNAINLSNYMLERLSNYQRARGKNTDNMMLNEYILHTLDKSFFQEIEFKWNYMPFLINTKKIKNPNFYHFVGYLGTQVISYIINNIKIENLETYLLNTNFKYD